MGLSLGYGQGFVEFKPPENYQILMPNELAAADGEEIERAIDEPLGQDLADFQGRGKLASILVSDITRPSPSYLMLNPLAKRLKELGFSDLKVIFALGTHRRMTPEEEKFLLKDCTNMPHIQHDPKRCVSLGQTVRKTPVEIFEELASSDLIVATGNIEYH